ncbi:MAG: hypothetical protein WC536_00285 [Patescibacteria group bacterium]
MNNKPEDQDTRYYIDLDLKTRSIIAWDYGQRADLIEEKFADASLVRIFITKGQFNKLTKADE